MKKIQLLMIDDDEEDMLIARDLLDDFMAGSYQLEWIDNFADGRRALAANAHDLCLMDYKLGAADGIELLRLAPQLGFSGPIILFTGMHQGEVDMQALEAGAVDYLVKNDLSAEQLARSIRYALARREVEVERVERLRAEAENRSKSDFLAHLSHEIRTPLSAILGFTELLINKTRDTEALSHLHVVDRNGRHLLGLLNDVLDLSKIEAGKLDIELQPVHLPSLLTDSYAMIHGAAMEKSLLLSVEANSRLPEIITTDPMRLRQILLNLLGNAIKFTDRGQVTLRVQMVADHGRELVQFEVEDTGVGIPSDAIDAIFQPFVQNKRDVSPARPGTGLGLTISRQLAARLGGGIGVESAPGRGSRFTLTIDPGDIRAVPRRPFALEFERERAPVVVPQFQGRVLVVDDLQEIRALVGHFVEVTGLKVLYGRSGREAVDLVAREQARGRPIDLIVMDIHMPEMGGVDAARQLRRAGCSAPILALTAAYMKGDEIIYGEAGFTATLSKPIGRQRLHAALAEYLPAHTTKTLEPLPADEAKTVLVVEDSLDALNATCGLLNLLGWHTIKAASAAEALEQCRETRPCKALLDINLPDGDGYSLAQELRVALPDLAVYLLSGEPVDSRRAAASGISGSVLKPISLVALQDILA